MRSRLFAVVIMVVFWSIPRLATACLCDKDGFAKEAKGRPFVARVVQGPLPVPSRASFERQLASLEERIEQPNPSRKNFDDLATAYQALERPGQAIHTLNRKLERFPNDHLTHARLANFHGLADNLQTGLVHVEKALTLAPTAAAKRSILTQKKVLTYLVRLDRDAEIARHEDLLNLKRLTMEQRMPKRSPDRHAADHLAAMIRDGWGENVHVWFALGRSLAHDSDSHLSVRAFLRARDLGHPQGKEDFCQTAKRAMDTSVRGTLDYCGGVANKLRRERQSVIEKISRKAAAESRKSR